MQLEIIRSQVITSVAAETEVEVSVGAIPNSGVIFGTILPFEAHHHTRKVLGDNGVEYFIGRRLLREARLSHLGEGSRLVFELGSSREAIAVSRIEEAPVPTLAPAVGITEPSARFSARGQPGVY